MAGEKEYVKMVKFTTLRAAGQTKLMHCFGPGVELSPPTGTLLAKLLKIDISPHIPEPCHGAS